MSRAKRSESRFDVSSLRLLALSDLEPTSDNRRAKITKESVRELAASIRVQGVLQPILVRRHPLQEGRYEVRAGARRVKAAQLAGLSEIPAIVLELDDAKALAVTVVENLQRENLTLMEQAETIAVAFDQGYDLESVAATLGLSPQQTARRAALLNLSPNWKAMFERGALDELHFKLGHLELVARLPHPTQDDLLDPVTSLFVDGTPSVSELDRFINESLRTLRTMPWSVEDETLVAEVGACSACRKRSGAQPLLFEPADAPVDGKVSKTDRCLDPTCYDRKQAAFVKTREADARGKHEGLQLVVVAGDSMGDATKEAFGDRVQRVHNPKFANSASDDTVPVMAVTGPRAGKVLHLRVDRQSYRESEPQPEAGNGEPVVKPKQPLTLEERRERLERRRQAHLVQSVREKLEALGDADLQVIAEQLQTRRTSMQRRFDALALVLSLGTMQAADAPSDAGDWSRYDELRDTSSAALLIAGALAQARQVLLGRLRNWGTSHISRQFLDAGRVCEFFGWDFEAMKQEAVSAVPTPKSHEVRPG